MRWVLLFSGQGAQTTDHLDHALAGTDELAAALHRALAPPPGRPFDAAAPTLYQNRCAQALIAAVQARRWQMMRQRCAPPLAFAGYSIGELGAFCAAADLPAPRWVELAHGRALHMDAASPDTPCGMLAVQGLSPATVAAVLQDRPAWVALINGPRHVVLAGHAHTLAQLPAELSARGARRCVPLAVETASHTPLLQAGVAQVQALLAPWATAPLSGPVLAGVDGAPRYRSAEAIDALAAQVAHPVDWLACMDSVCEYAPDAVLEIGPGNALARMFAEHAPALPVRALDDFSHPDAALAWLNRASRY